MKKRIVLPTVIAVFIGALLFAACSKQRSSALTKELKGEITFWHSFSQGPRMEKIQKAAELFMAENPGVKITIQTFSWPDFYTKWTTGLASGNVPDMSTALPNHVPEMIDAGALIPMDALIQRIGKDRFYPAPLTEMTLDDRIWAIPLYSHAQVMWYRKDLLKKYNLTVPQTWDEVYDAALKITEGEKGAVYGCSVPLGMNDMMATRYLNFYVRSCGETLLTADKKANLTSKAAIDGINYWVKMWKACSPKDSLNFNVLDQATLYYQGKNAFDFNSGFHIGGVKTNTPDLLNFIDCAPMPSLKKDDIKRGYETSNIPVVIWKKSKHPEICEAFIVFLYDTDRYIDFLLSVPVGMLPAFKDLSTNKTFHQDAVVAQFSNAFDVISNAVGTGTAIGMENGPCVEAGLLTTQRVIENMFHQIIVKGVDVHTAAESAEKKLNELFETVK